VAAVVGACVAGFGVAAWELGALVAFDVGAVVTVAD